MTALKLVHREGEVRCTANAAYKSRWGCYHNPQYINYPLNVIVTDQNNNIIFPDEKYIKNGGLWYYLPHVDALHSDDLVFTNYANPFYISKNSSMKIWFGEDLRNRQNSDSGGRVCVDVFAHLQ